MVAKIKKFPHQIVIKVNSKSMPFLLELTKAIILMSQHGLWSYRFLKVIGMMLPLFIKNGFFQMLLGLSRER